MSRPNVAQTCLVQRLEALRGELQRLRALDHTWAQIAALYPPVAPGTLCAILKGRVPADVATRRVLGLVGLPPEYTRAAAWLGEREER